MQAATFPDGSKVDMLIEIINDLGIDLIKKAVIPLGYDYNCDKKDGCARKFN